SIDGILRILILEISSKIHENSGVPLPPTHEEVRDSTRQSKMDGPLDGNLRTATGPLFVGQASLLVRFSWASCCPSGSRGGRKRDLLRDLGQARLSDSPELIPPRRRRDRGWRGL